MKKLRFQKLGLFAMALMSLLFVNCSDNDDSNTGTAKLVIKMADAPGDYDKVNIEVLDVLIKNSADTSENGWVSVGDPEMVGEGKIYDLLTLTGGVNVVLTDSLIPAGHLGQIRLLLGDQNTIEVDGNTYGLETPSGQQSGLKLKVNQNLEAGITYDFLLDFDVEKSIVTTGGGKYSLKPVINVSTSASSGAIKGTISPPIEGGYKVLASVQVGSNTISAYANDLGVFQLNGVPAGTYVVTLTPDAASGIAPKNFPDVTVTNGEITDMGSVSIP